MVKKLAEAEGEMVKNWLKIKMKCVKNLKLTEKYKMG